MVMDTKVEETVCARATNHRVRAKATVQKITADGAMHQIGAASLALHIIAFVADDASPT